MPQKFVHVRGYIGAAREGDDVNPEKRSSFSQFYVVTGKYYTDMDLDDMEANRSWKYTPEQREGYKLQGGAAHLDGGYTVFGRLIDGWNTIDKIQRVDTDDDNRPLKNVLIKRMRLYPPKTKLTHFILPIRRGPTSLRRCGASAYLFTPKNSMTTEGGQIVASTLIRVNFFACIRRNCIFAQKAYLCSC